MSMRRMFGLVFVLVVCAILVGAVASPAGAQNEPVPVIPPNCDDMSKVDLNGDGRLNSTDFNMWVYTVHESGDCELDGPIGRCPMWVDVNRDGLVSHADLEVMITFLNRCIIAPWRDFR